MAKSFDVIYYNSREEQTAGDVYRCLVKELNADLVAWVKDNCSGSAVILVNAEVNLPDFWQARLLAPFKDKTVTAVTALNTADYELSPLPAHYEYKGTAQKLDAWLSVLAPAKTYVANTYNPNLLALNDIDQLLSLDEVHVTSNLLVQADEIPLSTERPDIGDQRPLPAHPMATVHWLISQQNPQNSIAIDYPLFNEKPNLLHVVMDWGGGVHRWIDNFIQADNSHNHFLLVSEGEFYRRQYGEKYSLYYGGKQGLLLAQFELSPSIKTVAISHESYQNMLTNMLNDYAIGGLVVSSLIGHAMDCLSTGLPTWRVLHDYFPHWPSLDARLDADSITQADLDRALSDIEGSPFEGVKPKQLEGWQRQLNSRLSDESVHIVAPDESVLENIQKLPHSECYQKTHVISHGVTALDSIDYKATKQPFTVLVLGRLIGGKGKQLLKQVMDEANLSDVHWLLMGSGDGGDDFKNQARVTLIKEYEHSDLPELLAQYSPQLALMPARVSETFSYVLSELQQIGLPVLGTRVGALKNRIQDQVTGYLVDDDCAAISQSLINIKQNPQQRQTVHENLIAQSHKSVPQMMTEYGQQMADSKLLKPDVHYKGLLPSDIKADRLMQLEQRLIVLSAAEKQLRLDLADKAQWAQGLDQQIAHLTHNLSLARDDFDALQKQFMDARDVYEQRSMELSGQVDKLNAVVTDLNHQLEQAQVALSKADEKNRQLKQRQDDLKQQHVDLKQQHVDLNLQHQIVTEERDRARDLVNQMMQSRSWRLTRPLRGVAKISRRFKNKLSYRLRQLVGLPKRVNNSLKTRGMKATWQLAQQKMRKQQVRPDLKAKNMSQDFQQITLKTTAHPVVSVIVPVYNHFKHTYHCLKSIGELMDKTAFEVIVVDDCSQDETEDLIHLIHGIRYHRQSKNGGFIRSCNQGAQLATGQYLLFLNNDTEVNQHWLDSLVDTFEQHEKVGLVGSQLRYPDGRLQEAGGIVFSDASGWNYGRLESPDQPEVAHLREVSYCSGASIMVPTDVFKKLGYFDARYIPAYYEDTDLAFGVRSLGLRVLYQPLSQVVHYEGISSGTDLTSGVKKYQVVNQQKFAEKWHQALSNQPSPGTDIERARFQKPMKRILIVDACTPTPDQDSGSLRMINIIQILQKLGYQVSFMPENMAYFGAYTEKLQQMGVECVYAPKYKSPVDYLAQKGHYFSVVILSRYYVAYPLLKSLSDYAEKAQLWFDTVDLHYLREQRMAELDNDKAAIKKAEQTKIKELAVAKACDLTLVVSPYEQTVLAKEVPDLRVSVLSNIHEVYGQQKTYSERRDIVFMGGYQHTPNVDGICWFVREIWPQIQAALPDVVLHIVGSKAPEKVIQLGQQPGINFHGFVEDIAPMMSDVRIAVAPLRFGAGVKGKVNMSMSYGQPVVGTAVAVEGMFTQQGKDVLMADNPTDFADHVIRLYGDQDLWEKLSEGGLNNVERYFSFNAAKKVMSDLLNE